MSRMICKKKKKKKHVRVIVIQISMLIKYQEFSFLFISLQSNMPISQAMVMKIASTDFSKQAAYHSSLSLMCRKGVV